MARDAMTRRAFLGTSVLGGALAATDLPWPARAPSGTRTGSAAAPQATSELDEVTVAELQEGMRSGRWTARSLAEQYLARIDAADRRGPNLRTVLEPIRTRSPAPTRWMRSVAARGRGGRCTGSRC